MTTDTPLPNGATPAYGKPAIQVGQIWRRKNGRLIRIDRANNLTNADDWRWVGEDYKAAGFSYGSYIQRDCEPVSGPGIDPEPAAEDAAAVAQPGIDQMYDAALYGARALAAEMADELDEPAFRAMWDAALAARDARIKAETLREAAGWKREFNLGNDVWSEYLQELAHEKYRAGGDDMITIWLEDRADRIERDAS